MDIRICDACILEGKQKILKPGEWYQWGWTHSEVRKIHLCVEHRSTLTAGLKKQTFDSYRNMVEQIDKKAVELGLK